LRRKKPKSEEEDYSLLSLQEQEKKQGSKETVCACVMGLVCSSLVTKETVCACGISVLCCLVEDSRELNILLLCSGYTMFEKKEII